MYFSYLLTTQHDLSFKMLIPVHWGLGFISNGLNPLKKETKKKNTHLPENNNYDGYIIDQLNQIKHVSIVKFIK